MGSGITPLLHVPYDILKRRESCVQCTTNKFKPSLVLSESHVIKLPKINFGSYEVRWRAMGEDGHVLKGILTFEVKGK